MPPDVSTGGIIASNMYYENDMPRYEGGDINSVDTASTNIASNNILVKAY